jgi:hypothetical protein
VSELEIILLKKRLHNLEIAFQTCIGLLIDLQPQHTGEDLHRVLKENYDKGRDLGSYNTVAMVTNLDDVP